MIYTVDQMKSRLAVVILAYADYESLELALATHAKFSTRSGVKIYILQNGRGSYDCERTYNVGKRYQRLFPDIIKVVDNIVPGPPYNSLRTLFASEDFNQYEYIIKLDDDVLVLTPNWVEKLCECYIQGEEQFGEQFGYATTLVNNNPYGFRTIIEKSPELADEYFTKIARRHLVGNGCGDDPFGPNRILPKEKIFAGANGTIWGYPYIARWLHEKTTLQPVEYVRFAEKLGVEEVNSKERYSINCMLFRRQLWLDEISQVEPWSTDDEHLLHAWCIKNNKKILADLAIPMVHLFFFSQREECRDMIDDLRVCYTSFLQLEFPITICNNRMIEIENRLRFLEQNKMNYPVASPKVEHGGHGLFSKIKRGLLCCKEHGVLYTCRRFIAKVRHYIYR